MKSIICILALAAYAASQSSIKFRESIDRMKQCYSADKNQLNKCLLDFWQELRPQLVDGIPELKIPKLDPLIIHNVDLSQTGNIMTGKVLVSDVILKGLREYAGKKVETDIAARTMTLELAIPVLEITGNLDIDSRILLMPVTANGTFWVQLDGVTGKGVGHVEREGTSLRLARTDVDFEVQKLQARITNLLWDKEISDAINNMINDNSQAIFKDVEPHVAHLIGEYIDKVFAGIVKELPAEAFILHE